MHPVLIVAVREIFVGMGSPGLLAVRRGFNRDHRLGNEIVKFQGLDQIGVSDQSTVLDRNIIAG